MRNLREPHANALLPPEANYPWWHMLAYAAVVALVAGWLAAAGSRESLWVDELHTSWTVEGEFIEVADRARQGNQGPLFFQVLFGLVTTLGDISPLSDEQLLRLPSQLSWVVLVVMGLFLIYEYGRLCHGLGGIHAETGSQHASGVKKETGSQHAHGDIATGSQHHDLASGTQHEHRGRSANGQPQVQRLGSQRPGSQTLRSGVAEGKVEGVARHAGGCLSRADSRAGGLGVLLVAWVAWIVLDRIQLFYATEARVYGTLQLLSLIGWTCIGYFWVLRLLTSGGGFSSELTCANDLSRRRRGTGVVVIWCGVALLMPHIHLTSLLAVAMQIGLGTLAVWRLGQSIRLRWLLGVVLVIVAGFYAVHQASSVWEKRSQWEGFAGKATLASLLGLFPIVPLGSAVLAARTIDVVHRGYRSGWRRPTHATVSTGQRLWRCWGWFWLLATAGPWLLAWLLTYWEIAPIFHRRYVIASSVPLVLALISQLALVRLRWLRWLAVVIAGLCLCVEQGTWSVWRRGELIGSQRGEGWREATRWLNGQITAEDELWVASGLIEGQVVDLPLSERENVYLSFPLRGLYAIRDGRQEFLVEPQALVGEPTSWGEQLLLTSLVPQPSMPQPNAARRRVWLVYRGSAAALKRKSDRATEALPAAFQNWDISEIQQFGRVCVVRFEQR